MLKISWNLPAKILGRNDLVKMTYPISHSNNIMDTLYFIIPHSPQQKVWYYIYKLLIELRVQH
jgi:hypothetical protein